MTRHDSLERSSDATIDSTGLQASSGAIASASRGGTRAAMTASAWTAHLLVVRVRVRARVYLLISPHISPAQLAHLAHEEGAALGVALLAAREQVGVVVEGAPRPKQVMLRHLVRVRFRVRVRVRVRGFGFGSGLV